MTTPRVPGRVLLVDDEPMILKAYSRVLSAVGHDVHGVADGAAALVFLAANPIDVIVSDVDMPLMGGIELLRAVKTLHHPASFVLITGAPTPEIQQLGFLDGALLLLEKPVTNRVLVHVVAEALAARRQRG